MSSSMCPVDEISYTEFGQELKSRIEGKRVPLRGTIELTERCNLRCVHCYINQPAGAKSIKDRELAAQQWLDILDQLAAEACLWLTVTGGEPLLRSDWREIYAYIKQRGFLVRLFTNGTLINDEVADFLLEWPPEMIEISLYGASREVYEGITGVPGSYRACLNGINRLRVRDLNVELKTPVFSYNYSEFSSIQRLASELGLKFRWDGVIRPRLDGGNRHQDLRLAPSQVLALELESETILEEWQALYDNHGGVPRDDLLYGCWAGLTSFHIDSYGRLSICGMARSRNYDLVQGTFRDKLGTRRSAKTTDAGAVTWGFFAVAAQVLRSWRTATRSQWLNTSANWLICGLEQRAFAVHNEERVVA